MLPFWYQITGQNQPNVVIMMKWSVYLEDYSYVQSGSYPYIQQSNITTNEDAINHTLIVESLCHDFSVRF